MSNFIPTSDRRSGVSIKSLSIINSGRREKLINFTLKYNLLCKDIITIHGVCTVNMNYMIVIYIRHMRRTISTIMKTELYMVMYDKSVSIQLAIIFVAIRFSINDEVTYII